MSQVASLTVLSSAAAQALACASDIIDVLPAVMDAVRLAMRQHVGGGLSVPQFRCLNHVAQRPGVSVTALATFMGTTNATASANADRLARAGLLEAVGSTVDRRRSELRVTAAGATLLDGMRQQARQELAMSLAALPSEDVQRARAGLAVLKTGFGQQPNSNSNIERE